MCWNPDISINTFLFACFALLFIYITNTYTKYKVSLFENRLVYLFLFEVALMQLIEFFLWRNLKNEYMNKRLSMLAAFIICLQILTLILMIQTDYARYLMLIFGFAIFLFYFVYKYLYSPIVFHTHVGKNGHLVWEWLTQKGWENIFLIIGLLFYIIPALLINNTYFAISLIASLFVSILMYRKYRTVGSMWCWMANLFLLFFIVDILFIQPFYEYNGLC